MMLGNGMGFNWKGLYTVSLLDAHAAWRERADALSDRLKITMMVGQYFLSQYRGRFYAKAQNLARRWRTYDKALGDYDLLLMPTLPVKATPMPPADAPLASTSSAPSRCWPTPRPSTSPAIPPWRSPAE